MPFVNVKIAGESPTKEQKERVIKGITDVLVNELGKNPATTFVVIEEVPTDNWGIGGESVTERKKKALLINKPH